MEQCSGCNLCKTIKFEEEKRFAQFSTKLNSFFIKFWENLNTKSVIIYTKFCSPKNLENANFFADVVAINFMKYEFYVFFMKLQQCLKKSYVHLKFFKNFFVYFSQFFSSFVCLIFFSGHCIFIWSFSCF